MRNHFIFFWFQSTEIHITFELHANKTESKVSYYDYGVDSFGPEYSRVLSLYTNTVMKFWVPIGAEIPSLEMCLLIFQEHLVP
jgi:hypothetical protein